MRGTIDLPVGHEASAIDITFDPPFDKAPAFWSSLAVDGPVEDAEAFPTVSLVVLEWTWDDGMVIGAKLAAATSPPTTAPIQLAWIAQIPAQAT